MKLKMFIDKKDILFIDCLSILPSAINLNEYDLHIRNESKLKDPKNISEKDFEDGYEWKFQYFRDDLKKYNESNWLIVIPNASKFGIKDDFQDIGIDCNIEKYVTKNGRNAIKIIPGNTYKLSRMFGSGDCNWRNWENRRLVGEENVVISTAKSTSRGGGCWQEVEIWRPDEIILTAGETHMLEEIDIEI